MGRGQSFPFVTVPLLKTNQGPLRTMLVPLEDNTFEDLLKVSPPLISPHWEPSFQNMNLWGTHLNHSRS
jgi:hypothetical protein